ncbi:hypothetical protein HMPREF1981_00363 [Bacteroides pyogenes F0041]|uniref:Uncharacterized protein n=1 Tax=Bacteroides pyogenes F0041 TaxID=1321819 RepID=U2CXD3_9BACE|nr:hypothetical protein HMPREF1981_00363 [Bacteroides pyogenes F0041]
MPLACGICSILAAFALTFIPFWMLIFIYFISDMAFFIPAFI